MDQRRFLRMSVGGLVCVLIAAMSLVAFAALSSGGSFAGARTLRWLVVPLLGLLGLEIVVLTISGLVLLVWTTVSVIAGPSAPAAPEVAGSPRRREPRRTVAVHSEISAPVTPTALVDPDSGISAAEPITRRAAQS